MIFSQTFIERVRESANIVDVIGQYTSLRRVGSRLTGLCPFPDHREKTPSFSVSEDRQLYHCFGCGKGGNVYTFLQTVRGMAFGDAVEYLADRAGIPIERDKSQPKVSAHAAATEREDERLYHKLNQWAAEYYHFLAKKMPPSHEYSVYMQKRQLSTEIIDRFKLGVAPNQWDALAGVFSKRNLPLAVAEKLGLVKKRQKGDGYFDQFRERLIFPIFSVNGEVQGFGGRTFGDDQPKYLNSPETPVFNKGKTLYGLHETAKYIRSQDQVILVEGYMDLLALYSAGIKNGVAVLGTAFTENHAKLLKRYSKNVVVLFDADSAGQRAAQRSLPILLAQGLFPRQVELGVSGEGAKDPDDYIQAHGVERLKTVIAQAPEFFIAFLQSCLKDSGGGSIDKIKAFDRVGPLLNQMADERLRDLYFRETLDRLGVSEEWLRKSLSKLRVEKASSLAPEATKVPAAVVETANDAQSQMPIWKVSELAKAEQQLIQLALKLAENLLTIEQTRVTEEMSPEAQEILQWVLSEYRQSPNSFDKLSALLASKVDQPSFVTMTLSSTPLLESDDKDRKLIEDCVKWIRGRFLRAKGREIATGIHGLATIEQLEQFMNVQKQRHSLGREVRREGGAKPTTEEG